MELLIVLIVILVLAALGIVLFSTMAAEDYTRRREQSRVRGIVTGLFAWSQNNADRYPLPSLLDIDNTTVPEPSAAKDTTANIYSILAFNGFLPVEFFVSPAEVNPAITPMMGYQLDLPVAAVNPAKALWDPAFSADFTASGGGNASYAHLLPSGERRKEWGTTFTTAQPIVVSRGPEVVSVTKGKPGKVTPNWANPTSNTFKFHGGGQRWRGAAGFRDNHVDFATRPWAVGASYTDSAGTPWPDIFFFDEPDDAAGSNTFLGIFTRAGPERKDVKAIWD